MDCENHVHSFDAAGYEHCLVQEMLDEYKRRAEETQQELGAIRQAIQVAEKPKGDTSDVPDLVAAFIDHHKTVEGERDALAVQYVELKEVVQYILEELGKLKLPADWERVRRGIIQIETQHVLTAPRAAKIAGARRRVCEADYALEAVKQKHGGTILGSAHVQEAERTRHEMLAELWKAESENA